MKISAVEHIGVSVSDLDAALAFWEPFLGRRGRRRVFDFAEVGEITGYPGVTLSSAFLDLPGGVVLELIDYQVDKPAPADPEASATPGHLHFALEVDDIDGAARHAVSCGARLVSDGPVLVDSGPFAGAQALYLRVPPDSQTVELLQPPPQP
jgi:catechol 2,3-dioxygenase-like lactoylglutathione lyase family enzyme